MSDEATSAVLKHSRSKGAARLVLLVIASHADPEGRGARLSMDAIALGANASARAVQYAVAELENDLKELVIPEKGNGRGHPSLYDLSALVLKGAKSAPFSESEKGEQFAPFNPERAQNLHPLENEKGADFSSKGADFSGTEVAPSKAKNTSTEQNINNGSNAARAAPAFAHEVPAPVQVYRDVFGTDPPPYGQDQIERDVTDLALWRETCKQWKGNNNDRTKVWNMVDAYRKKVKAGVNEKRSEGQIGVARRGGNVSARTKRQDSAATALITGAAERLARAGRVRGGGEPPDS